MSKFLKYTIGVVVTIFVLFLIGGFIAKRFINPERLEAKIVTEVHNRTGRDLVIKDGLSVSFFPHLRFSVQEASLSNPPNFGDNTPFANIGSLEFSIELLPFLLEKRIVMNEIILNDSTFNLITLSNGQTNWKDFSNKPLVDVVKSVKDNTTDTTENKDIKFDVGQLEINRSTLNWKDVPQNQEWQVTDLNVDSSDIALGQAFPLKMNGKYNEPNQVATTWDINSKINIDTIKHTYTFEPFSLKANIEGKQPVSVTLSALEFSEANQIIALKDAVFSGANINGKGNLDISSYKKNPKAKGQFSFDTLALGDFKTTNVNIPITLQNNVFTAKPITSKLYGGTFTGNLTVDNAGKDPQWQLTNYQLANIDLVTLLADMGNAGKFSGVMQSNGQLSAVGLKSDSIKSSLSGSTHFKIDNGVYTGIDLTYWWNIGNDLVKTAATAAIPTIGTIADIANVVNLAKYKNTNQTAFTDISADFSFKNGVGTTNNLILYNDIIYVKATGQIDIVNKSVDLKLFISQSSGGAAKGTEIPFTLKGNFDNLQIKPDVAEFPAMAGKTATAITKGVTSLSNKAPESLKKPIQQLAEPLGNAIDGLFNKK